MMKSLFCATAPTEDNLERFRGAGFNALTLQARHAQQALITLCRRFGFDVYLEIGLFVGETYWQNFENARPVDRSGKHFDPINGYYGVCPNHPQVRAEQLEFIRTALELEGLAGLYLDFIRYPCHWEAVRSNNITEYCFCSNCLQGFRADGGNEPQGEPWYAWKCKQITDFVKEVRTLIELHNPQVALGVFAVPWHETDFDKALRKIIAQDRVEIAKFVDSFAPMVYHELTANPLSWIAETSKHIQMQTFKPVVPVIQAVDVAIRVSPYDLKQALELALNSSSNVMVFYEGALVQQPQKLIACQEVFQTF